MAKQKDCDARILSVSDRKIVRDPMGDGLFHGRELMIEYLDEETGTFQNETMYVKDDSPLGFLFPRKKRIIGKNFNLRVHLEVFESGFHYLVVDEIQHPLNCWHIDTALETYNNL